MGSINTNGTAYAESYIEGPFPAGPWTYCAWAKAGLLPAAHPAAGVIAMLLGDYSARPSFNSRSENPDIRYGLFDQSAGVFSSVTFSDDEWVFYVLSSDGGSSSVRWTVVTDQGTGTWTITESHDISAASLPSADLDAVYLFLGTLGSASRVHEPLLLTSIKIYETNLWSTGAGSGADIITQARTRDVIYPSDLYGSWQWDGSTTANLDDPDEGSYSFETWVSTGVATSTDEPTFPDDGGVTVTPEAVVTDAPTVGEWALTPRADLTPEAVLAGAPVAEEWSLAARADLAPEAVTLGAPVAGEFAIVPRANFSPEAVTTDAPTAGEFAVTPRADLAPEGASAGAPTAGEFAISIAGQITPEPTVAGAPTAGRFSVGLRAELTPESVTAGAPVAARWALTGVVSLAPESVITQAPTAGRFAISESTDVQILPESVLFSAPTVGEWSLYLRGLPESANTALPREAESDNTALPRLVTSGNTTI